MIARRIGPFPEIVGKCGGVLFSSDAELRAAMARIAGDPGHRAASRAAFESCWRDAVVVARGIAMLRRTAVAKGAYELAPRLERVQ